MKVSIIKGDEWHRNIELETARQIMTQERGENIKTWQIREAMQTRHELYGWVIRQKL